MYSAPLWGVSETPRLWPSDYEKLGAKRVLALPSTEATLQVAAVAAQAARVFANTDPDYAALCLANAEKCYQAAKDNPALYVRRTEIGSGDQSLRADTDAAFYWAACELLLSTGKQDYATDQTSYEAALGADAAGGAFVQDTTAKLGDLSQLIVFRMRNTNTSDSQINRICKDLIASADAYLEQSAAQGFGLPYQGVMTKAGENEEVCEYTYGSNGAVADHAMLLAYAYDLTNDDKYLSGASAALDYLFGRNAMDYSYVTGYGTDPVQYPFRKIWAYSLQESEAQIAPGVLVGGANSQIDEDKYMVGAGYQINRAAPQQCYRDEMEAWSVNGCSLSWNASLAWVTNYLDEATSKSTGAQKDYGDVNCSGKVDLSDVILLARFVAEDEELGVNAVSAQGKENADIDDNRLLTADDIVCICRVLAGLESFPNS